MWAALEEAVRSIPELGPIHRRAPNHKVATRGVNPFRVLWMGTSDRRTYNGTKRVPVSTIEGIAERIGGECMKRTEVHESESMSGNVSRRFITDWNVLEREGHRRCRNRDVIDWLASWGFESLVLDKREGRATSVDLYLVGTLRQDPAYVIRALAADPRYDEVFEGLTLSVPRRTMPGDHPDIQFDNLKGRGRFGGRFVLRYTVGWGDCPSGCINHHFWTVEFRSYREKPDQRWQFVAVLVSEGGTPLPEDIRQQLRCGRLPGW